MFNCEKSREELKRLFKMVGMEVQVLRQDSQKNKEPDQIYFKNLENQNNVIVPNLQQNIQEIKIYSQKLIDSHLDKQKQVKIYKQELELTQKELQNSYKKIKMLRNQLSSLKEKLDNKQQQIKELKAFNMIDVSFIPSVQIINLQQQKQKQSTHHDSREELKYENSGQVSYEEHNLEEIKHEIPRQSKQLESQNLYQILEQIEKMGIKEIKPEQFFSDFNNQSKKEEQNKKEQEQASQIIFGSQKLYI